MLSSAAWLFVSLLALLAIESWLHRHLQGTILLIVRNPEMAILLYSLLFLPGVLLHELSHWIVATLLLVRTGRVSLWPAQQADGTLRLGYVETERVDFVREALIGAAPLLVGGVVVSIAGLYLLDLGPVGAAVGQGDVVAAIESLADSLRAPDAWLWFYTIFAVSNSMLPSASDRRAWPLVGALALAFAGLIVIAGPGPALVHSLAAPVQIAIRAAATVFSITIGLDVLVAPLVWLSERGVMRMTGMKVEY